MKGDAAALEAHELPTNGVGRSDHLHPQNRAPTSPRAVAEARRTVAHGRVRGALFAPGHGVGGRYEASTGAARRGGGGGRGACSGPRFCGDLAVLRGTMSSA